MSEPQLEAHTLVLLRWPERLPDLTEHELEALQAEHVAYQRSLRERGIIAVAGPFEGQPDERWRAIPIVMLTAYGQDELVSRAVEAGVFGYLVKPFREQDLLPAIRAARARHEELLELREEAESLADALAARKAIERAKGLLMEKEGLSEQDAFARLRKASQVSGRPLKVVAEAVVATLGGDT